MVNEEELLDIVVAKLKSDAVSHYQRIKAKNWEEMKELLRKEFGENCSVESIFSRTETLAQRQTETFRRYAERARHIVELVKTHASDNEGLV
ncbi:hypothetical protein, partial [Acinetobacter baumannii]|uniref:hypothetical protein n=1 Tax=Acinetobacter baumannii TaxID=470 RepID=UPI0011783214